MRLIRYQSPALAAWPSGSVEHPERRFEFAFGIAALVQLRAVDTTAYRLVSRARSLPEQ